MNNNVNRRDVLKLMGVGAAAGLTAASCGNLAGTGRPGAKWRMRLSTSSIQFMQLSIEQACERVAGLGFEGIDIWSAYQGCRHLDEVAERLGPDGLNKMLAKYKLKLCAFSVYRGGYEKYAELLGRAGGGVAIRGSAPPCTPEELTAKMREFMENVKPLVQLAEKYNSYLAIENHGGSLLDSLDSLKLFVDMNASPRLGIALAPYHLQTINASVPEAIRICGRQLFFFYAWQRAEGLRQLPGIGPTDMTPWIQALADVRYAGYVNPFMHGHPEPDAMVANLAKSRDYLRTCHQKIIT
ncbi:MAG TPA: sugar phosphate isomerase/epimerase [Sedimentisphaerales bacterium]|nr:sugar phosphate isomerase/epimerase [Sedimentisphaerales bacterium]